MTPLDRLHARLATMDRIAVAVSGGIDSLTLATAAHRAWGISAHMYHATSPAVPAEATERTLALAEAEGWRLEVFDAGEFADPVYLANPVDRCFYCKTNLYAAIAGRTGDQIVSGTNVDDLGEYRPGLIAAGQRGVRHPFVEAGIDKRTIRRLATTLGLGSTLAELPASPCLSSRIETGIRIEAPMLSLVHRVEQLVAARLSPQTVRCRVRSNGVVIELDEHTLASLDATAAETLQTELQDLAGSSPLESIAFAAYRNGSAFLRPSA